MSPNARTRVLIVDADSALRQGLARELGANPAIEVVATAMNVRTAEPKIGNYQPDIVVLDLEHDTEEALAMIGRCGARPGSLRVVGIATDAVADPVGGAAAKAGCAVILRRPPTVNAQNITDLVARLCDTIVCQPEAVADTPAAARPPRPAATGASPSRPVAAAVPQASAPGVCPVVQSPASGPGRRGRTGIQTPTIVGIGVSTGGPAALQQLIPALPADFPLPVVVVQHMPAGFTKSLAESLDKASKVRVREAGHHEAVVAGEVLIAPGGRHLRIVRRDGKLVTELTDDPPECSCRPSVDYLFRSLATACGARVLGVVLTGMGEDGWIGSRLLDAAGGVLLAQDEATCTVYGMPRGPIEQGLATAVALPAMAAAIDRAARSPSCS